MGEPSSLFPAYVSSKIANKDKESNLEWLTNSSFTTKAFEASLEQSQQFSEEAGNNLKESCDKKRQKIARDVDDLHRKRSHIVRTQERSDSPYFFNKKYDPQNFALGSLDFKTIPKYLHPKDTSVPLGVSKEKVSDWSTSKKSKRLVRYFSKSSKKRIKSVIARIYPLQNETVPLPEYLSFNVQVKERIVEATSMPNFDGISSTWKTQFNESVKELYASKEEDYVSDVADVEVMEKITKFNRALMDSPRDEDLWLEFLAFQREIPSNQNSTEAAICNKQIAILDRALKHNPSSVRLSVAKLELLKNSQSQEEHISLWDNMIFFHPNDVFAWSHYLRFLLSDIAFFNVTRITKLFAKCLKMLMNIQEGKMTSHLPTPTFVQDMIGIFSSICKVFYGIGYQELALAAFQAQIEFNLFPPAEVVEIDDRDHRVSVFEPFWDSGVPRIGEKDAIGWSNTVKEKCFKANVAASVVEINDLEDNILSQGLPEWSTWLEFEKLRQKNYWLPWRIDPESEQETEDLDDQDRLIGFEQISKFLFRIMEEKDKFYLLCEFFTFLGLQLHDTKCSLFVQKKNELSISMNLEDVYSVIKDIFPDEKVPESLCFSKSTKLNYPQDFIDNVYQQSCCMFSENYKQLISLIWLRHRIRNTAMENNRKHLSNLKKNAKSLLKKPENRNCLFLWSEYLSIEWLLNNKTEANRMFEALLTSSSIEYSSVNIVSLQYFVGNYIELFMGIRSFSEDVSVENRDRVLWILSHIGRQVQYTLYDADKMKLYATVLMKTQNCFKTIIAEQLKQLDTKDCESTLCCCTSPYTNPILMSIKCAVYFLYFFQSIESSIEIFQLVYNALDEKKEAFSSHFNYIKEQITVFQAELQSFHCWFKNTSIIPLQTLLTKSIEMYPSNIKLLYLLLKIKCSSKLIGPTRRFFYKLVKSQKNLSSSTWLFAIIAELIICLSISDSLLCSISVPESEKEKYRISNCGIVWKIRSLFENATKNSTSRNCIAIWRSYMKFEMVYGDTGKAKSVFHQALQVCPWFKALYLDGIGYFSEDLRYLLETMSEKQIRLHTPLEEISLLMEHACKNED